MSHIRYGFVSIISFLVILSVLCVSPGTSSSSSFRKWKKPGADNGASTQQLPAIAKQGTLRVGMTPGMMPFGLLAKSGALIGFDVDLATDIANRLGMKLELKQMKWDRLIPGLLANEIDLIVTAMEITEDRQRSMSFVPYFSGGLSVLVRTRDSLSLETYRELNNDQFTIAIKQSEFLEKAVRNKMPHARISRFPNYNKAVEAVRDGRATATVADLIFNRIVILKYGPDVFTVQPSLLTEQTLGIGYRKTDQEFGSWLDNYIGDIKKNGTYDRIEAAWFNDSAWLSKF